MSFTRVCLTNLRRLVIAAYRYFLPMPIAKRAEHGQSYVPKHYPNGNMADAHAEIRFIQQAYEQGITKGEDATLDLNGGKVCDYCFTDLVYMAQAAELRSLTIYERVTGNKLYWEEGMTKLSVSRIE